MTDRGARFFRQKCIASHDEAWRAESALRPAAVHHRRLQRMQLACGRGKAFDGSHAEPIDLAEHRDAGIDRQSDDSIVGCKPLQDHRAGAAVALGAAFLGAGQTRVEAQPVEQRHGRRPIVDLRTYPVESDTDRLGHGSPLHGRRCD
jgi:hypothetical protein